MMTIKDRIAGPVRTDTRRTPNLFWLILIALTTVFLAGIAAGYFDAQRDLGHDAPPGAVGAGLVVLLGLAAMAAYLRRFGAFWQSWSPRKRLYTFSIAVACLTGFAMGMLLTGGSHADADPFMLGDNPLSPRFAILASVVYAAGIGIALPLYYRAADDHERRAFDLSCIAGFHAFAIPAPIWWLLGRADLTPPVETMPLVLFSIAVNGVAYLWFKFR